MTAGISDLFNMTVLRHAATKDIPWLNDLYNHYILKSTATFDLTPHTVQQRLSWLEQFAPHTPHQLWILEDDEEKIGYASSQPFRAKAGYQHTVETSIYLTPHRYGQGFGKILYERLFLELDKTEVCAAIAMITLPNPASIQLHAGQGFRLTGNLVDVGRKFDQTLSVCLMQRSKAL